MAYIYILYSRSKDKTYTGSTDNLKRRLHEHNLGFCKSTKLGKPWQLLYTEEYSSLSEARKREKYFKTGFGRRYLQNRIGLGY